MASLEHDNLRSILVLMHEFKVRRIAASGVEVELHESAFEPVAAASSRGGKEALDNPSEGEERCVCGHLMLTEHTSEGCLHGCSVRTCERQLDRAPEE